MAFLVRRLSVATATFTRDLAATSLAKQTAIKNVTIIGGGHMGSQIAQAAAQTGHSVTIADLSDDLLGKSMDTIRTSLQKVAKEKYETDEQVHENFLSEILASITMNTDFSKAVQNADLVVEAIVEEIDIKRNMFASIDKAAPPHTIFASNTSSLSISEIASVTQRKDRFGGLHFFSPVATRKLLEVVRIPETSEDTHKKLMEFGKAVGNHCIVCKDTPGFIVNRLIIPCVNEAVAMLERGDATAEDIDFAMKYGVGNPMGLLELADYAGLDIIFSILSGWNKRFRDNQSYRPSPLLAELVAQGKLGRKTGDGFFRYK